MPASYKIDKERRFVLSTASGVLTKEDILDHQERLTKDPDFDPSFSQLSDFTQANKIELTPADIRVLAEKTIFSSDSRRAIVVKDDFSFGLARMFEVYRETKGEHGVRVFRDMKEALNWLFPKDAASR